MKTLLCSLVQMAAGDDAAANFEKAESMIRSCPRSDVYVLPEMFILRGSEAQQREQAEDLHGPTAEGLATLARELRAWIVGGSVIELHEDRRYNTCLVFNRQGRIEALYRKIHLFDVDLDGRPPIRESANYSAGSEPAMVHIEGWKCGLSICYDLRFPELYRTYARFGAHAVFAPSNFTDTTGRAHWSTLVRARAIENQCYLLAPNQCGTHPHLRVKAHGHSMAVGPWGDVQASAGAGETTLTLDLDPAELDRVRTRIPALEHRRWHQV
jgi:nitrilase